MVGEQNRTIVCHVDRSTCQSYILKSRKIFHSLFFSDNMYISQVEGLCKLLNQNRETLKSLEFVHCKLSSTIVDTICDSLYMKGVHTHTLEHFSIKTSSFLETNQFPLPVGLASFLSSARCVSSLVSSSWLSILWSYTWYVHGQVGSHALAKC